MFQSVGGRPGILGTNQAGQNRPGAGVNTNTGKGPSSLDITKQTAATTLLSKTLQDHTSAVKYFVKDQAKSMKDLSTYNAASAKLFQNSIQQFSATQLNVALPKKIAGMFDETLTGPMNDFADVLRLTNAMQTKNIERGVELFLQYQNVTGESADEIAKKQAVLREQIEGTGQNFEALDAALKASGGDAAQATEDLKKKYAEIAKLFADTALKQQQLQLKTDAWISNLTKFAGVLLAGASIYLDSARASAKFGTQTGALTPFQAAAAGMSVEQLAQVQNEQVQAIHSSNMSFSEFNTTIDKGAWNLLQFTGNLADGAKLTANFLGTFRSLSNNTNQQNGFMEQQAALFGRMNREFGETAEQFAAFNTQLVNNQGIQTAIYKLNQNQRVALVQDLQLQYEKLRTDGLTEEQAKKVIDALAQLAGETTLTRFQQGAQAQGILGALGVSNAADIGRGIRSGTLTEDQIKKVNQQLSSAYQGASAGRRIVIEQLTEQLRKSGLDFFGAGTAGGAVATAQGRAINKQQAATLAQTDYLGNKVGSDLTGVVTATIGVQNVIKSEVGKVITTMLGIAAGKFVTDVGGGFLKKGVQKFLGTGLAEGAETAGGELAGETALGTGAAYAGGLTGLGGASMGTIGAAGAGSIGLASAAVLAAGGAGYVAGMGIDMIPKLFGSNRNFSEMISDALSDDPQINKKATAAQSDKDKSTEDAEAKTNEIMAQFKKTHELTAAQLQELKRLSAITKNAADLAAAQSDDHIRQTKKLVLSTNDHLYRPPTKQ
jgi:hypothetical protein